MESEKDSLRDDGSTASTAVLVGNHLYVANVGDSRTIVSKKGKGIFRFLLQDFSLYMHTYFVGILACSEIAIYLFCQDFPFFKLDQHKRQFNAYGSHSKTKK